MKTLQPLMKTMLALLLLTMPAVEQSAYGADGTQEAGFKIKQLAEGLWCIEDQGFANMYLLQGTERALLIDTGVGSPKLRELVHSLTQLPLEVVNTHGHPDHSGGNSQFKRVHAHAAELKGIQEVNHFASRQGSTETTIVAIGDGFTFDLGDRKVDAVEAPGHTTGSLWLIDRKGRVLFSGDNITDVTLMFKGYATPLDTYMRTLERLNERSDQFDLVLPAHGSPLPKTILADQISCVSRILNGTCTGTPYKQFPYLQLCTYKNAGIAFDSGNIHTVPR